MDTIYPALNLKEPHMYKHLCKYLLLILISYYGGRTHEKHLFNAFEAEQRSMWAYHFTPEITVLTPERSYE